LIRENPWLLLPLILTWLFSVRSVVSVVDFASTFHPSLIRADPWKSVAAFPLIFTCLFSVRSVVSVVDFVFDLRQLASYESFRNLSTFVS